MRGTFVIDCLPESAPRYVADYAIVAIDVIRATTLATTAVATGHPCYFAVSVAEAFALAATLDNPLMAGELNGAKPDGFDMNNSPGQMVLVPDKSRPVVMLSSSGTRLLRSASPCRNLYVACLRNFRAVSRHICERHGRIAIIGAGSKGSFREEDQLCCAWIARELTRAGYLPENTFTESVMQLWSRAGADACARGASAAYLERTGQLEDLTFVIDHVDDLDAVFEVSGNQVVWAALDPLAQCAVAGVTATARTYNSSEAV